MVNILQLEVKWCFTLHSDCWAIYIYSNTTAMTGVELATPWLAIYRSETRAYYHWANVPLFVINLVRGLRIYRCTSSRSFGWWMEANWKKLTTI